MTEVREQDRLKGGPTITLDLPTVRFLRMKATRPEDKDTFFVVRGLEGVGTSIEVLEDENSVEKLFTTGSRELGVVACGAVRSPTNVEALKSRYIAIGDSPEAAAIYGANSPQASDFYSPVLQKVDGLSGKQVPRLIVGKYGNSAIINPFSIKEGKTKIEPGAITLPLSVPKTLVSSGTISLGSVLVYDVKAEVDGEVVFSGTVGDANFFAQAISQNL